MKVHSFNNDKIILINYFSLDLEGSPSPLKRIRAAPQQSINPSLIYGPSNDNTEVLNSLATPPMTLEHIDAIMFDLPAIQTPALVPAARARQRRTTPAVPEIEADASPNRQALHAIVSKYFRTPIQCRKVVDFIDSMEFNGFFSFNDLIEKIPSNSRPTREQRILMLQELNDSSLITLTQKSRGFIIKKGSRYEV